MNEGGYVFWNCNMNLCCIVFILFTVLKMHVLDVNDIFGLTFYTCDRILEVGKKNGPDALALYIKLIKQSRIQQTNQTKSLNIFLKNGLGWGDERLKKAKYVLKSLGLVDDLITRDKLGKITGHYVRVNYLINEDKVRTLGITYNLSTKALNPDVATSISGQTDTNALSNININAGSNTKENLSSEGESETQKTQSSEEEKDTRTPSSTEKEGTPPTPPQLLEAYEKDTNLVQMIGNSDAVLERAEYKQSKKDRAYKTVKGFIQQLYGKVNTVRFGELRGDTGTRFEYAVNKTKENEWKDIYRTEKEEREYQFYKKSLYLKKQENE